MRITYVEGTARGPTGKEAPVRFLVDSGATYSLLPAAVWQAIELAPTREQTFALADGTLIQRQISRCYLILPQGEDYSPVILGEPGDEALLGVVTLEILGLVLNPFNRTLQPMRMLLA
jgi:predicted aspartyl protease